MTFTEFLVRIGLNLLSDDDEFEIQDGDDDKLEWFFLINSSSS